MFSLIIKLHRSPYLFKFESPRQLDWVSEGTMGRRNMMGNEKVPEWSKQNFAYLKEALANDGYADQDHSGPFFSSWTWLLTTESISFIIFSYTVQERKKSSFYSDTPSLWFIFPLYDMIYDFCGSVYFYIIVKCLSLCPFYNGLVSCYIFQFLQEIKTVELVKPIGWVHISLSGTDPR